MAKQTQVKKSDAIRELLKANRKMKAKEVVEALAAKGIPVLLSQVYFVKGQVKGGRKKTKRIAATENHDPLAMILKVKSWASQVGGMKKLKELVDAMCE